MKAWLAGALVAAAVLLRFPPERYGFYPRCPFFEAFGLLCPGCGATRAAAALLHGRLVEAWQWNALFVTAVSAVLTYRLICLIAGRRQTTTMPRWAISSSLAVAMLFAIARNIR